MKNSKFYRKPPLKERIIDFAQSLFFWRGRRKGAIYTRDITLSDLRAVFFPRDFHEKYQYLGSVPLGENPSMLKSLVLAMDAEARPSWCPRWFLRFLHLFGSDNSIVRVRNRTLHNLQRKLTKGILMWDYKTKWSYYDLRISISAPKHLQDLADAIEDKVYRDGKKEELTKQIRKIEPEFSKTYLTINELQEYFNNLIEKHEQSR
jgi:hypothetical protein